MNLQMVSNINVDIILRNKGLNANGRVQQFLISECDRYMVAYLPYRTGMQIKNRYTTIDGIVYGGPYAKYLYYGKLMIDPMYHCGGFQTLEGWFSRKGVSKVLTNRDLNFDTTKNPLAGSLWDKRMWADHKQDILSATARLIGGNT